MLAHENGEAAPGYVGCPWQCRNYKYGTQRCELWIRIGRHDGSCVGSKCVNYEAWEEATARTKELHETVDALRFKLKDVANETES